MDDPRKIKYSILEQLLTYAPKIVIVQILLNVDPEDIAYVCSINKRVHEICNQQELQRRHKKKYPGFFYGNLKEYQGEIPNFIREKRLPEEVYTDGHDNWVSVNYGFAKYASRNFNGYRLVVELNHIQEDYWMKNIYVYDSINKGLMGSATGYEVVQDILKSMGKTYLNDEYYENPETEKARKMTDKFMKELIERGAELPQRGYYYAYYDSSDDSSSDDSSY